MREAQGYLMPVLLAILMPITFLLQAILAGHGRRAGRGPDLGAAMDSVRGARAARDRHSDLGGGRQRHSCSPSSPRSSLVLRRAAVPGEPARAGAAAEPRRDRRPHPPRPRRLTAFPALNRTLSNRRHPVPMRRLPTLLAAIAAAASTSDALAKGFPLNPIGLPFAPDSPKPLAPDHPLYHQIALDPVADMPARSAASSCRSPAPKR